MRGREKQRQIAHEGIQRLAGGAPSRFDGKFGGVHGVPELGEPGGAEAGGRLLFGLLTYLTNLYFKIKEDKRKAARGE